MVSNYPRVLIIDNDREQAEYLKKILEYEGYSVMVAEGHGRTLIDNALQISLELRPHVAIVDLRISGPPGLDMVMVDDQGGLEFIKGFRNAHCILRSAYLTSTAAVVALTQAGAFYAIGVEESPQQLLDAVNRAALDLCASHRNFQIHWPAAWNAQHVVEKLFGQDTNVPSNIVEDIIGCLFCLDREVKLENLQGAAISPQSVSRGRSCVLKAWPDRRIEPLVVKLARAQNVIEEEQNYKKYIDGNLKGAFHAILHGQTKTFWELGGVVYSFVGAPSGALLNFADFFKKQQAARPIVRPLRHFFTDVWAGLYQSTSPLEQSIFEAYDEVFHLSERFSSFPNKENRIVFPGIDEPLINPVLWAGHHKSDSRIPNIFQAVTHGDLHGDNLFVSASHAWAIDFERSGPGHILRDFVELEVDVITRLVAFPENDLSKLYELAIVIAAPTDPLMPFQLSPRLLNDHQIRKAIDVIAELRKIAHKLTNYRDSREYLWALLLDALFVATLVSEESAQRARTLLLSSVLCNRLRLWGQDWPPKGKQG